MTMRIRSLIVVLALLSAPAWAGSSGGTSGGAGTIGGTLTATDNVLMRTDGTGGLTAQGSNLTCSDVSGVTTTLATITPAATTGASVAGQSLAITASPAVASTDTAGAAAGGAVTITAGAAARNASGNADGGSIFLDPGTAIGTGVAGLVEFGPTLGAGIRGLGAGSGLEIKSGSGGAYYYANLSAANIQASRYDGAANLYTGLTTDPSKIFFQNDTAIVRNAAGVLKVTDNSTGIRGLLGGGAAVASATAMPVPTGRVFHVTGTTTITSITSTNFQSGACVTLIFDGILTFTDGSNLKLAGDFVTTADDTISLCYDGTSWFETSRAVN